MSGTELSEIDELVEIEDRTNSDGSVTVTIETWEKTDNDQSVKVTFELIDTTEYELMDWPRPGDGLEEYKFYRLVRSCGLEMRNADLLEGETATARGNNDWYLDVPEQTNLSDQIMDTLPSVQYMKTIKWRSWIITIFWIVILLGILYSMVVAA